MFQLGCETIKWKGENMKLSGNPEDFSGSYQGPFAAIFQSVLQLRNLAGDDGFYE